MIVNSYFRPAAVLAAIVLTAAIGAAHAQQPSPESEPLPSFAKLETSLGDIYLRLRGDKAPTTVENFAAYARDGFYEGTIFHRVVADFVIQGGGFTAELEEKPTQAPIRNEADNLLPNKRGAVAMARTMDPHSATSQFFINVQDNMALDHAGKISPNAWGYAVFAEVVRGMDVVDNMRGVAVGPAPPLPSHVPKQAIIVTGVSLLEELPAEPAAEASADAGNEPDSSGTDGEEQVDEAEDAA